MIRLWYLITKEWGTFRVRFAKSEEELKILELSVTNAGFYSIRKGYEESAYPKINGRKISLLYDFVRESNLRKKYAHPQTTTYKWAEPDWGGLEKRMRELDFVKLD